MQQRRYVWIWCDRAIPLDQPLLRHIAIDRLAHYAHWLKIAAA
ncbi:hypothetical protein VB780_25560 [Leptolyngbya sp. CCNP1308]|nr:hypothetical protein [Leptolyngbya sp. CCNP1308]MEA5451969.1 hypothetical protein [Leptolyngbya sp. CCNP1308]